MSKTTIQKTPELDPSAAMLKKARQLLTGYTFVMRPDGHGSFIGSAKELPGVLADGVTLDECARNLTFALETVIASNLADGATPPAPETREKRTEQVNVRFTRSERDLLEY